jgi:hypothetical protein
MLDTNISKVGLKIEHHAPQYHERTTLVSSINRQQLIRDAGHGPRNTPILQVQYHFSGLPLEAKLDLRVEFKDVDLKDALIYLIYLDFP